MRRLFDASLHRVCMTGDTAIATPGLGLLDINISQDKKIGGATHNQGKHTPLAPLHPIACSPRSTVPLQGRICSLAVGDRPNPGLPCRCLLLDIVESAINPPCRIPQ
jgi:hypothetical protein